MENKINIAELLKDCPKGMELYSPMLGVVYFEEIIDAGHTILIKVTTSRGSVYEFYPDGKYNTCYSDSECLLFPAKDQRDWSKFQRPFKDGDVVVGSNSCCSYIAIYKGLRDKSSFYHYAVYTSFGNFKINDYSDSSNLRFATEEEKQKLFQAIKDNGYKWNAETKILEELSKFKTGDKLIHKDNKIHCTLGVYAEGLRGYLTNIGLTISDKELDEWELASNKFDITTLKPFESRVLVRDINTDTWVGAFYSHYKSKKFYTIGSTYYYQCIPYEENKHLLDTTNDCDDYYKTWEE